VIPVLEALLALASARWPDSFAPGVLTLWAVLDLTATVALITWRDALAREAQSSRFVALPGFARAGCSAVTIASCATFSTTLLVAFIVTHSAREWFYDILAASKP
jgi:hypothetical protein